VTKKGSGAFVDAAGAKPLTRPFADAVAPRAGRASDFIALTKPRLNFLVVATAAVGYYLGSGSIDLLRWVEAIVGTALVAGGAAGLNQVYERDTDSLMWRTRSRPLAAHRLTSTEAAVFSLALATGGLVLLATRTNALAALLAALTLLSYNVVYTPMKRRR
jgi:protoheme IX farnesyltransferase